MAITIQTNGRMLAKAAFMEELCAIAPDNISFVIALHSHEEKTHDEITRRRGSFRETVKGVENLRRTKFATTGKMVLSNKNVEHIARCLEFCGSLGFSEVIVAYPHAEDFDENFSGWWLRNTRKWDRPLLRCILGAKFAPIGKSCHSASCQGRNFINIPLIWIFSGKNLPAEAPQLK